MINEYDANTSLHPDIYCTSMYIPYLYQFYPSAKSSCGLPYSKKLACLVPAQVLTLINGDRISMPPMVRLLFEVADLAQASPATVSRAGMATKQH